MKGRVARRGGGGGGGGGAKLAITLTGAVGIHGDEVETRGVQVQEAEWAAFPEPQMRAPPPPPIHPVPSPLVVVHAGKVRRFKKTRG